MVYFTTTDELAQAFSPMIGVHDASVLEIGAGSGRLITMAKGKINNGFCVAVDAVQGFITTDIPWAPGRAGLSVSPSSTPHQDVHLLCALATDPNLSARIRALPGAP
ncbi:hypothetical protein G6011_08068 [Alternaria panax]|uniref:Uncharacterized protein n=1 Tax=Alternaria panax TaxID=48097 RepID=A0AAD4I959_9PLEO|nr:hypothetical protein G6011_11837 [Alternaria panax]KAG9187934.1 hypothetical protein G6011_01857 [Alternaria panax]KAG9189980.1 hypothetical protein G6011_08068 [Alternaria panax]